MATIQVTSTNFEKEVLKEKKSVLVDFWAPWCGPCKAILHIVEELSNEKDDMKVCKVNVDEQSELAQNYGVITVPTLLLFKNGKVVKSSIGAKSKESIAEMLK